MNQKPWLLSNGKINSQCRSFDWWKKRGLEQLWTEINQKTYFLPENSTISQRLYCFENDLKQIPRCAICGGELSWDKWEGKYKTYCGPKCSSRGIESEQSRLGRIYKHSLSDSRVKSLHREHLENNIPLSVLSTGAGFHASYLRTRCNQLGLKSKIFQPKKRIPLEDLKQTENLIRSGYSVRECEEIMGIGETFIYKNIVHPNNLPLYRSGPEVEILHFIRSFYDGTIISNSKKIIPPLELDIFLPDFKLAIEYCGLRWHQSTDQSFGVRPRYHLDKLRQCIEKDIKLLTIFENEWLGSKQLIKSIIKNKLGFSDRKIYARNTELTELSSQQYREFLEENHLQRFASARVKLGLLEKSSGELLSVAGFGKSRFNKRYDWELVRYANKINCSVVGGASKLLKQFENQYLPQSLVSYADRRYSEGNLYKKLGFQLVGNSLPNYFYYKDNSLILHSRIEFQKHKLEKKLPIYDSNLSEKENMKNNGWYAIYDCGNAVYVKNYNCMQ
jgi:hypothetical protein